MSRTRSTPSLFVFPFIIAAAVALAQTSSDEKFPVTSAEAAQWKPAEIAYRACKALKENCYRCHGDNSIVTGDPQAEKAIPNILDYAYLTNDPKKDARFQLVKPKNIYSPVYNDI